MAIFNSKLLVYQRATINFAEILPYTIPNTIHPSTGGIRWLSGDGSQDLSLLSLKPVIYAANVAEVQQPIVLFGWFHGKSQTEMDNWVCLKMVSTPLYPMVLLIIIPLWKMASYHWEY